MTSVGEILRRERLARRLELDQIAQELKISVRFLEAIEHEEFDKLPGGVFAKSFVRQYAQLMGLDPEELSAEVQRILEPVPPPTPFGADGSALPASDIHVPRVEPWEVSLGENRFSWSSSLPSLAMVVVAMLVCSGIYSWWQRGTRRAAAAHEAQPVVQAPVQPPAQTPVQVPPQEPAPLIAAAPAPAESVAPAASQVPSPTSGSADRPMEPPRTTPLAPVTPAANTTAPPAELRTTPAVASPVRNGNVPLRLELTAAEPVWVLVRGDGKFLFSGTLEPQQTRSVEAQGSLLLRLGNAGGVSITFNGKPLGTVGPKGQVRTVQFTSGGFQIVAAPKLSLPLDPLM